MADRHTESHLMTPPASPLPGEEPEGFEEDEDEEIADEEMHEMYKDEYEELYEDEYEDAYGYHQVEYDAEYEVEEADEFYEVGESSTHSYPSRNSTAVTAYLIHRMHHRIKNIKIGPNLAALILEHLGVSPYDPDYTLHLGYLLKKPWLHRVGAPSRSRRQSPLPEPPSASTSTYTEASTSYAESPTSLSPAPCIQRLPQGPPEYLQQAPFIDFPDEPKWHLFESIQVCPGEEEVKDEHHQFMEYHQEILQGMDRAIEEEVRWYISHMDTTTKGIVALAQQEPVTVSMVLVDPVQTSTSAAASHGEGGSGGAGTGTGPELISSIQRSSTAAIGDAPYESESFSRIPSSDDGTHESAGQGREMSSIERTLRAQAVTALNNPSALLLHAISMNETPSRARLRMYRHLTGQPQPPHEYAPESVKQAYRETEDTLRPEHSHIHAHADSGAHDSSSSSAPHSTASANHRQQHHQHQHQYHLDDDVPMDDEFGPTYFQGALDD
ncbi:hypothetical protein BGW39_007301 [Mortierella sp. 14UC]|nr:hypothetical protein BGW39_007301 [Mortierella sp. 14UC]